VSDLPEEMMLSFKDGGFYILHAPRTIRISAQLLKRADYLTVDDPWITFHADNGEWSYRITGYEHTDCYIADLVTA